MKVGIFGLGYVGVVNAACFTKLGHTVTGCDIKQQKVESLRKGISPISEPKVNDLLAEALKAGLLKATTDVTEVVRESDVLLICVGTPSNENGEVNLDYIFNTTKEIAQVLNGTDKALSIVYRSTIPPNTLENFIRNIYKKELSSDFKGSYRLAFYPEFLREGKAVDDFFNAPRIVIGTEEKEIETIEKLVSYDAAIPLFKTNSVTAEFVKYVDNCFHALKVAYVNEIYTVGKQFGVDIAVANEIFLADRSLNISPTYLRPGMPFGGSCLPKDLRAVNSMAAAFSLDLPLLRSLLESNKKSMARVMELVKATGKKKVLFAGFTFKNHTDDYRESPVLIIINEMLKGGYDIEIIDEDIDLINLRIDKPSIVKLVSSDMEKAVAAAEVVVVTKRFMEQVQGHASANTIIINCTGKSAGNGANMINLY